MTDYEYFITQQRGPSAHGAREFARYQNKLMGTLCIIVSAIITWSAIAWLWSKF